MGRNKLDRFAYNEEAPHVVQEGKSNFESIAGNWGETIFHNNNPITLEIGCGHAEYTLGLAKKFSDKNFIGVDVKGARIFIGAKAAEQKGLTNAGFLRLRVHDLENHFVAGEVEEFWITFPDPRPRDRDIRRRLVNPRFLNHYRNISKPGSIVNLKTDNYDFYQYGLEVCEELGLEVLASTDDLYQSEYLDLCHEIQTTYEQRYLAEGIKINYLRFKL